MTIRDLLVAAIRTVAQVIGAYIIASLLAHGWDFPDQVDAQINVAAFLAVLFVWNFGVNWAATHIHPAFGYLSLIPKQPTFPAATSIVKPENAIPPAASAGAEESH